MISSKNVIALLLGASHASNTADETYTNTLASCLDFAAQFDNTCDDLTTKKSFSAVDSETVTCSSVGQCPVGGSENGDNCSWERKLCVSCYEDSDSIVKVRAQTNGLPNHCYNSP